MKNLTLIEGMVQRFVQKGIDEWREEHTEEKIIEETKSVLNKNRDLIIRTMLGIEYDRWGNQTGGINKNSAIIDMLLTEKVQEESKKIIDKKIDTFFKRKIAKRFDEAINENINWKLQSKIKTKVDSIFENLINATDTEVILEKIEEVAAKLTKSIKK